MVWAVVQGSGADHRTYGSMWNFRTAWGHGGLPFRWRGT